MKYIDTLEKWDILSRAMKEKGWMLKQFQYSHDHTEGFHAWFCKEGKSDVEVVTRNEEVEDAIVKFNSK